MAGFGWDFAARCRNCRRRWARLGPLSSFYRRLHSFLLHPANPRVRFGTEATLCGLCWRQQCKRYYEGFSDVEQLALRALAVMETDRATARAWASEAVRRRPNWADAYALRARIEELVQDLPAAIRDWSNVLRIDSRNVVAWFQRGQCQFALAAATKNRSRWRALSKAGERDLMRAMELAPRTADVPAPQVSFSQAPRPMTPQRPDPLVVFRSARELMSAQRWAEASALLSDAIRDFPSFMELYLSRAYCRRKLSQLDAALSDYDKAIELNAQSAQAWLDRGASKVLKAYEIDDRELQTRGSQTGRKYGAEALKWFEEALIDYKKGAALEHSGSAGLSVLELEVILDKYREAIGTAATWWNTHMDADHKLVCAWLGAIATILAGKRPHHWQAFREYLEQEKARPGWEPEQIDGYLHRLQKEGRCPADRLAGAQEIHRLFLAHYSQ